MIDTPSASAPLVYSVTGWNDLFENNRSRVIRDLTWVPIPNKHDGERYSRLMQHKQAAPLFAAWILLLEVASKCQPRGRLVRTDGTPYDTTGLSLKTRAPEAWFALALPYFARIGWLTAQVSDIPIPAPNGHTPDAQLTFGRQAPNAHVYDEGKEGREGKGMEWKEGKTGGSVSLAEQPDPTRARMQSVNALFHRKDSTRWSAKEWAAFRDAGLVDIDPAAFTDDFQPLATYYAATPDQLREHWRCNPGDDFRRRDLLTLLHNWPGEVDRARAAAHFLQKKSDDEQRARG